MLQKFKEEREKRKMAPPSSAPSGAAPLSGASRSGDHRSSRGGEFDRDRDRGYERQGSRYECVFTFLFLSCLSADPWDVRDSDRRRDRERSRSPRRRF